MEALEGVKPQCGGGAGGDEEEYDLPLHIAAVCRWPLTSLAYDV